MSAHEKTIDDLIFSVKLVKAMIPFVASNDVKWKHFKLSDFNTNQYTAHDYLYNDIRNKMDSLRHEAEKKRKDAEKAQKTSDINSLAAEQASDEEE